MEECISTNVWLITPWDQCTVEVLCLQSMVISLNFVNPNFGFLLFASLNFLAKDMCTELVTHYLLRRKDSHKVNLALHVCFPNS